MEEETEDGLREGGQKRSLPISTLVDDGLRAGGQKRSLPISTLVDDGLREGGQKRSLPISTLVDDGLREGGQKRSLPISTLVDDGLREGGQKRSLPISTLVDDEFEPSHKYAKVTDTCNYASTCEDEKLSQDESLAQNGVTHDNINISKSEFEDEEISETLKYSNSPDWPADDYFDKKMLEHSNDSSDTVDYQSEAVTNDVGPVEMVVASNSSESDENIANHSEKIETTTIAGITNTGSKNSTADEVLPSINKIEQAEYSEGTSNLNKDGKLSANTQRQCDEHVAFKGELSKISSILRDAEAISKVLDDTDMTSVYQRLNELRRDPNRIELVSNEVLEGMLPSASNKIEKNIEEFSCLPSSSRENGKSDIIDDVSKVIKFLKTNHNCSCINPSEVYSLLETNSSNTDRVDIVVKQYIAIECNTSIIDIFTQVEQVMKRFPEANPDEVYCLLESENSADNGVEHVLQELRNRVRNVGPTSKPPLLKDDSDLLDPKFKNDPLFQDMRTIAKIFPDKDRNEIYAFLEAHYHDKNRIQVVTEELLRELQGSMDEKGSIDATDGEKITKAKSFVTLSLTQEVEQLLVIFPDCDPNYLYEELEKQVQVPEHVQNMAARMYDTRNYPKLKDFREQQEKQARIRKMKDQQFEAVEFLTKFPDPSTTFTNEEKIMSEKYKEHATIVLKNYFPIMKDGFIKKTLETHNFHFATTLKELQGVTMTNMASKRFRQQPRTEIMMPADPDEYFYHELLFTKHEQDIKEHTKNISDIRILKVEEARIQGELLECSCCFDDECLLEDMMACSDGHLFCKDCVKRSSETVIGDGKSQFPCLEADCEHVFPLSVIQVVLPHNSFSSLLRRLQEEEVKQADIPDLISCPFCSFATIMPDPENKVFKCLQPDCLKESCRLCKEPNHVPLRCEEVEKQGETNMRTYIENKISEAMLRTCWKCKKRFFKIEGCNKMTCSCGATMCYTCREPNIDYEHFGPEGCPPDTDIYELHRQEMQKAGLEAKRKYTTDNPGAADVNLKYDPFKHLDKSDLSRNPYNRGGPDPYYDEEGSDYDNDDDDYEYGYRNDRYGDDDDEAYSEEDYY